MFSISTIFAICLIALAQVTTSSSSKRGLIYIPSENAGDTSIYTRSGSDLSWYYNYSPYPVSGLNLSFVPMLATIPDSSADFFSAMYSLVSSNNPPTHVLSFNEPDMATSVGGSGLAPHDAAQAYLANLVPLRNSTFKHLQISIPVTSGSPIGLTWLNNFKRACKSLNHNQACPADFLAAHWYGPFPGMASWLGQLHALYPHLPIWVTEFADPSVTLEETEAFFNQSTAYLRTLSYVERYAWFGSFRSSAANGFVGPNVSFLTSSGKLTNIGSWYLGFNATGNSPQSQGAASSLSIPCSYAMISLLGLAIVCQQWLDIAF